MHPLLLQELLVLHLVHLLLLLVQLLVLQLLHQVLLLMRCGSVNPSELVLAHVVWLSLQVYHIRPTGRASSVDLLIAGVLQRFRVHYF